jgi:hypothetical protein
MTSDGAGSHRAVNSGTGGACAMADMDGEGPIYFVEQDNDTPGAFRVMGPNGPVGAYPTAADAQAKADYLNEQIAEEMEDDS